MDFLVLPEIAEDLSIYLKWEKKYSLLDPNRLKASFAFLVASILEDKLSIFSLNELKTTTETCANAE